MLVETTLIDNDNLISIICCISKIANSVAAIFPNKCDQYIITKHEISIIIHFLFHITSCIRPRPISALGLFWCLRLIKDIVWKRVCIILYNYALF